MTLPATALPHGNRLPSDDDRAVAGQLRRILAAAKDGEATLRVPDPDTKRPVPITLTPALADVLLNVFRHISNGEAVTLVPIHEMLTTQQAADLLNVSRPYFIKLLEEGELSYTTTGRHRRVRAEEVFAYKAKRDAAQEAALAELIGGDADLY